MTSTPTTSVPEAIIQRLLNIDDEIWNRAKFPESSISWEATKTMVLKEIREEFESYGNHRELEGRIDEYLNAEQAWFNYVQDDYFNDRQGQLESQKENPDV